MLLLYSQHLHDICQKLSMFYAILYFVQSKNDIVESINIFSEMLIDKSKVEY